MALRRSVTFENMSVVEAAEQRIKNVYANGTKVYISFSGGKDSIALIGVVYDLMLRGEISPAQTTVVFIDEEGMFDCIIESVMKWRKRMMALGCEFLWFCMEYKHYNCLNTLSEDESFICWDRYARDRWIRPMPKFAITSHPLFKPRKETYQSFCKKMMADGISLIGLRCAESHRRAEFIPRVAHKGYIPKKGNKVFPIYDWTDGDVYKYMLDHGLELPAIYQYLWESGSNLNQLRVSQFFSIDTAKALVKMNEYYPDLMQRVQRREPNAYLVSLYIDSEMFRRNTATRRKLEAGDEDTKDYKAMLMDVLANPAKYNKTTPHELEVVKQYKRIVLKNGYMFDAKAYKRLYNGIMAGDPKTRTLQATVMSARAKYCEKE